MEKEIGRAVREMGTKIVSFPTRQILPKCYLRAHLFSEFHIVMARNVHAPQGEARHGWQQQLPLVGPVGVLKHLACRFGSDLKQQAARLGLRHESHSYLQHSKTGIANFRMPVEMFEKN